MPAFDCLLCDQATRTWLNISCDWRAPENNIGPFPLRWCDSCRFGAMMPRPDRADIAAFYDVPDYYTHADQETRKRSMWPQRIARRFSRGDLPKRAIEPFVHGEPVGRMCDIGCGDGKLLEAFAAYGSEVVGIEPDPHARERAALLGFNVFGGTAEDMPGEPQPASFDMVTMMHVLEHCLDPVNAVENAIGLLKHGGRLVVEVPNNEAIGLHMTREAWPWLDVPRHLNFFTTASLRSLLEKAGLAVEHVAYRGYSRQFNEEWRINEQRIRQAIGRSGRIASRWLLLARTAFAKPQHKFDSVRITARVQ